MSTLRTTSRVGILLAAAALALSGCTAADASAQSEADAVVVTDAWVKAVEDGMTAAFGEVENTGTTDVTIVSAETDASPMIELHETVDDGTGTMTMQEKDGGFVIAAGDTLTLEPGGNHIMFMGVAAPIVAGDEVTITLVFSDGSTLEVTAPAKDYSGANEEYVGDDMDHDSMDMDG
ncbi:hypothetical protein GCM10009808_16120 [Microbacterium sediminicola]|uniref:Copper chaperone PCu(A)C n=1 Tax=Microbacterium sediminicola TaxID=415210 RepID=A0ABP4U507_9MICO